MKLYKFKHTCIVEISQENLERILESENSFILSPKLWLYYKLKEIPGVSNIKYNNFSGPYISFDILDETKMKKTLKLVKSIIKKHIKGLKK